MGAYLSQPKTDKVSTDEFNELLAVGASSMQGWRNSQEDAHNSILNFDINTSFFAVYDGHGGAEVATYCADKLPQFLRELAAYKSGNFQRALKEAFLGFDKTLLQPQVVEILKILAGERNLADADDSEMIDDEDDVEDLAELHEESNLPLNVVLEKYKGGPGPSMPALNRLKDGASSAQKPQSPYLRGRRAAAVAADAANKAVMDPDAKPQGSSTSAAAAAAASSDIVGPGSTKSTVSKMETDEPEEDSTVSSSSSSASKSNNNNLTTAECTEAEASISAAQNITTNGNTDVVVTTAKAASSSSAAAVAVAATAKSSASPDSSLVKESEQNGSVTSSQAKRVKADVTTSASSTTQAAAAAPADAVKLSADDAVSGSSDAAANKQNGNVGSTSNKSVVSPAISSTSSKEDKKSKNASITEDDSSDDDYDVENAIAEESDPRHALEYSSDEDVEEEDASVSEDDSTEDEEGDEEEDEEGALANEQFCANMIEEPGKDSGCTAVVALLNGRDLYVANAGDSRCVVCRNGKAIEMSLDHKPEDDEESSRIIKAGGRVTLDGRVNGGLNLSRAIGDHAYKMSLELPAEEQMISALPDIKKLIITPEDEFMVLACDGIWNYMTSEEVVDFVRLRLKDDSKKMSQICEELFDNCLAPNTMGDGTGCDNMTAVIVRFEPKILELPTKIKPDECEDILQAKQAVEADAADANFLKSLKRCASPTASDNSSEAENANKIKRLKTDEDESSSSTSTTTTTNNNISAPNSNEQIPATSSSSTSVASTEQKECDSVNTTSEAAATAVSST